ncbi:hypothetical protein ZWY2020_005067, partial [Hordeum vulgare]
SFSNGITSQPLLVRASQQDMSIERSSNTNMMAICIYQRRPFEDSSPLERQKVCSHTNTSPCTYNAEGDALQLTSKETRPEEPYIGNPAGAFVDPKPHRPGRDPVRVRGGYGLP